MDIRKQLIILILVFLCAPVSAQKKEKLITLKFTYPSPFVSTQKISSKFPINTENYILVSKDIVYDTI